MNASISYDFNPLCVGTSVLSLLNIMFSRSMKSLIALYEVTPFVPLRWRLSICVRKPHTYAAIYFGAVELSAKKCRIAFDISVEPRFVAAGGRLR